MEPFRTYKSLVGPAERSGLVKELNIYINSEVVRRIEAISREDGESVKDIVTLALLEFVEKYESDFYRPFYPKLARLLKK
jgi:hypothetical protein